jgi:prophage tail gpP-like protein
MAASDTIGFDDEVTVSLAGRTISRIENYRVESGIFSYPCAYGLETGAPDDLPAFLRDVPPRTPFELLVGDHVQFTGQVDAVNARGDKSKTSVHIQGRDMLAPLHRGTVAADRKFEDESPEDLFRIACKEVGLDIPIVVDATASRKTRTGVPIISLRGPRPNTPPKKRKRHATVGQSWMDFLQTEFQHAGLFPWCAPGPVLVLAAPDTDQEPLYRIYRNADRTGNVELFDYGNDTAHRWAELRVYGSASRGAYKTQGAGIDEEMRGWGYTELRTVKDTHVTTDEEAEFYATRKLAESRRNGRRLVYTVTGHSSPTLDGRARAVWCPDTVVQVDDDVLGFHDRYWLEDVSMSRSESGTTSTLKLMRFEDLRFGQLG